MIKNIFVILGIILGILFIVTMLLTAFSGKELVTIVALSVLIAFVCFANAIL